MDYELLLPNLTEINNWKKDLIDWLMREFISRKSIVIHYDTAKPYTHLWSLAKFVGTSFGTLFLDWIGPESASTWWQVVSIRKKRSPIFLGPWGSFCDKQLHIFHIFQVIRGASLLSWEKRNPPKVVIENWLLRYVRGRFKN